VTTLISIAVIILGFGAILWRASKAGADGAENKANKEALNEIMEAARPATTVDIERVRDKYSRD